MHRDKVAAIFGTFLGAKCQSVRARKISPKSPASSKAKETSNASNLTKRQFLPRKHAGVCAGNKRRCGGWLACCSPAEGAAPTPALEPGAPLHA